MSRFDAVIFDMDGVIVDSEPIHKMSFLELWQEMGYGDNHGIHFPDFYGRSDRVLWETFIENTVSGVLAGKAAGMTVLASSPATHRGTPRTQGGTTGSNTSRQAAHLQRCDGVGAAPGQSALSNGKKDDLPLAVGSGSAHRIIDEVLAMRDLSRYFRCTVSSEDVEQIRSEPL